MLLLILLQKNGQNAKEMFTNFFLPLQVQLLVSGLLQYKVGCHALVPLKGVSICTHVLCTLNK